MSQATSTQEKLSLAQTFAPFDPLAAKQAVDTEVAANAIKREIKNILNSYVGWFDPFCELIQNALDAVEAKKEKAGKDYTPKIWITVNIQDNSLIVTDNGIGLTEIQFRQFLAPNFSFKSGKTRGHKGVGATYLAYGFNRINISTKTEDFSANGKMTGARNWLGDENPSGNPQVTYDKEEPRDPEFRNLDSGVSIYVEFDSTTHPKDLKWIGASKATQWAEILITKTGLGAIKPVSEIEVEIRVIDREGKSDTTSYQGISYKFLAERIGAKTASYKEIEKASRELHETKGPGYKLPSKYQNLDILHEHWTAEELEKVLELKDEELAICRDFLPTVFVEYTYSAKVWQSYNEKLDIRSGYQILSPGIQLAANNMPQGEIIQIPLQRYTGRQNQIHLLIHFENCSADLGRKGFSREITDFSKDIAKKICDNILPKYKNCLRAATGTPPDIIREKKVAQWKKEMEAHESSNPLNLIHEHFFLPSKKISITSVPTREQDVIALFNQMVAGGVIRGVKIMSTNERFTYDSLYRVAYEKPDEQHVYNPDNNPLGVKEDIAKEFMRENFRGDPQVLEYKFSLDSLIEDFTNGDKNAGDVNLAVVWETGKDYKAAYGITSLLNDENLSLRQFHGATHSLTDIETGSHVLWLVVLSELIAYLNDPETTKQQQIKKYEEN